MAANKSRAEVEAHGYDGAFELGVMEIENPYFTRDHKESETNPKRITVPVNKRHDVIMFLRSKKVIDEAQFRAGMKFRALLERAGARGARAMDYTREHVDGGSAWPDTDVRAIDAANQLAALYNVIGKTDYPLLEQLIITNSSIADVAKLWDTKGRDLAFMRRYLSRRVRDALDLAAKHWGFAS